MAARTVQKVIENLEVKEKLLFGKDVSLNEQRKTYTDIKSKIVN